MSPSPDEILPDEILLWRAAQQMVAAALSDMPVLVASACAALDPGQLERLARAANMVKMLAETELVARSG